MENSTLGEADPKGGRVTPTNEIWSHSEGVSPFKVTVYENVDRDRTLYLRWREDRPGRERNWTVKSLKKGLRTAGGRIILEVRRWAIEQAKNQHLTLVRGAPKAAVVKAPLRLGDTEAKLIDEKKGKYPKDTPHRREVLRALRYAVEVWGKDRLWESLKPEDFRELWRGRMKTLQEDGHVGHRGAEVVVARILAIAEWLRSEQVIPISACHIQSDWKTTIRTEAGEPEPSRPRYTLEEMRSIIRVAPEVDPRFGLLVALGAELRLGQVVRTMRSGLDLDKGQFRVFGRGKKLGALVILTPGQVVACRRALAGYLRHLEATAIDYPLWPSGKLIGASAGEGVAKDQHATRPPVNRRTIGEWWNQAEELAGIPHVPGRGAYGVRRVAVDGALAEGVSLEGLQAGGGWSDIQVPQTIYRESELASASSEAARVRAKVRGEMEEEKTPNA